MRGFQKLIDLTEVQYEVANYSEDFYYYSYFFNENYGDYGYYYGPAYHYIFPNRTQYSKLENFLANSANVRNRHTIFFLKF